MTKEVFPGELESMVKSGALLIDVRESQGDGDALPGHTHIPLSRLSELVGRVSSDRPVIFYCRSGLLSFQAAEIASGWTEQPVYYLSGGLLSYHDS